MHRFTALKVKTYLEERFSDEIVEMTALSPFVIAVNYSYREEKEYNMFFQLSCYLVSDELTGGNIGIGKNACMPEDLSKIDLGILTNVKKGSGDWAVHALEYTKKHLEPIVIWSSDTHWYKKPFQIAGADLLFK